MVPCSASFFGHNVHGNLAQIQVCADSGGGSDTRPAKDILYDFRGKFFCGKDISFQVCGHVHEYLVDGIYMVSVSALPQRIPISMDLRMSLFEYSLADGVCLSTLRSRSKSMAESICPGTGRPPYGVTRLLLNEKLRLITK